MKSTCTLATVGAMAVGFTAFGLIGATAANAAGVAPVGGDDYYSVAQGGTLTIAAPGLLANDTDPEGDPLHVGNSFGYSGADIVQVNLDGSFQFTPDPNFYGTATFAYYPADDASFGAEVLVHITVTPTVPNAPVVLVAADDMYATPQDTVLTVPAASGILANDSGPGIVWAANGPAIGSNQVAVNNDGSFTFTPAAGFVGTTHFTYRTSNGNIESNDATVTLTVGTPPVLPPVPVAPTANPDSYSTPQDTVLTVPASGLLANDSFPTGAVIDIDDITGEIVAQLDGSFVYTPVAGFVGSKEFNYRMTDGTTLSAWAHVTIAVTATPAGPAVAGGPLVPLVPTVPGGGTPPTGDLPTLAYTGGTDDVSTWLAAPAAVLMGLGGLGLWYSRRRAQLS